MKHLDIEKYKNYSDFEIEGYHSLYKDIYSEFESVSPEKYNLKLLLISLSTLYNLYLPFTKI